MLLDSLAQVMLVFANGPMLLVITLIAGFFLGRTYLFQTACLMFVSIVINVALKSCFKIPLSPALHKLGYAFPSGHTQMATVFYLWLILHVPYRSRWLFLLLLFPAIGAALIHFGYHNLTDVIGGFLTGVLLVYAYRFTLSQYPKYTPTLCFIVASIGVLYTEWTLQTIPHSYAWVAYGIVCLLLSGDALSGKSISKRSSQFHAKPA